MKKLIMTSAFHLANGSPLHKGTGIVDAAKALDTKLPAATHNAAAASDGLGTLEAARGTTHLAIAGHPLLGEQDIFGHPWNATTMATSSAQRTTWTGGQWNANQWTGNGWTDGHWATTTWPSPTWAATNWTDPALTPASWTGASWTGASWTGASWS